MHRVAVWLVWVVASIWYVSAWGHDECRKYADVSNHQACITTWIQSAYLFALLAPLVGFAIVAAFKRLKRGKRD